MKKKKRKKSAYFLHSTPGNIDKRVMDAILLSPFLAQNLNENLGTCFPFQAENVSFKRDKILFSYHKRVTTKLYGKDERKKKH